MKSFRKTLLLIPAILMTSCASKKNVLMVITSYDGQGTKHETGYWAEEFVTPYQLFTKERLNVIIASPKGGTPPADKLSLDEKIVGKEMKKKMETFYSTKDHRRLLDQTLPLSKVNPDDLDAVFIVGGHGAIWDLVVDQDLQRIIRVVYGEKGVVSAVCHGPAALVNIKNEEGEPILKDHEVTGFSNEEERQAGLTEYVKNSNLRGQLEERLKQSAGANRYKNGPAFQPYVVESGNVVTGQNPGSSEAVAEAVVRALEKFGDRTIRLWNNLPLRFTVNPAQDAYGNHKVSVRQSDLDRIKKSLLKKIEQGDAIPVMGKSLENHVLVRAKGTRFDPDSRDGSIIVFFLGIAEKRDLYQWKNHEGVDENYDSFLKALKKHVDDTLKYLGPNGIVDYWVVASEEYEIALMKWESAQALNNAFQLMQGKTAQQIPVLFGGQTAVWENPMILPAEK